MNAPFKEMAEIIGISETALQVYFFVLEHGELPEDKITELANKSSQEVQKAIHELHSKHLISHTENKEMFFAKTILQMQDQMDKQKQLIEDIKNFVWPTIQCQENRKFFQFEGWDDIKQVYMESLQDARKSKLHFVAFENNLVNNQLGDNFVNKYIELRTKYSVKAYVICPDNTEDKEYKKKFENKYTEIKLIPDLNIDENIIVVGNSVMSFSPDTLQGDFHRNTSKANTIRSLFWRLWND